MRSVTPSIKMPPEDPSEGLPANGISSQFFSRQGDKLNTDDLLSAECCIEDESDALPLLATEPVGTEPETQGPGVTGFEAGGEAKRSVRKPVEKSVTAKVGALYE